METAIANIGELLARAEGLRDFEALKSALELIKTYTNSAEIFGLEEELQTMRDLMHAWYDVAGSMRGNVQGHDPVKLKQMLRQTEREVFLQYKPFILKLAHEYLKPDQIPEVYRDQKPDMSWEKFDRLLLDKEIKNV